MKDMIEVIEWFKINPDTKRIDFIVNNYKVSAYKVNKILRIDINMEEN